MDGFTTSIVIPVYGNWTSLQRLLDGLANHEAKNINELILVDDDSPLNPSSDWLRNVGEAWLITNPVNLGFTKAANIGLRAAEKHLSSKHITFLISTDVQINGKFVEQTADILFGARRALVGNRLVAFDSGWNKFGDRIYEYLEGYFLAATSDGWRDLGYFDEQYAKMDYEDVDLSTTAKSKGYKLIPLNNPNITHLGGGTYGYTEERRQQTERNKIKFREKWIK